ncbi:putative ribonuclease H-like domain-containing protein [Tanacetum coccineum]
MLIELINSSGLSKDKPVKSMGSLPLLDPLPKAFKSKVVKDDPQKALKNKGIVDSGCSRHMTRNKAYLVEYQDYNGGPVAFRGKEPNWLFDLDYLTDSMNYQPVRSENQANKTAGPEEANHSAGTQDNINAVNSEMEADPAQDYFVLLICSYTSTVKSSKAKNEGKKPNNDTSLKTNEEPVDQEDQAFLEELGKLKRQENEANDAAEALRKDTPVSTASHSGGPSYPNLTNYADQDDSQIPALEDIYGNPNDGIFTNASYDDEGAVADFTNLETIVNEELLQFKIQKVWILVGLPYGKKAIGTKWVYRNKKDERGVVVRNKARIEAIRIFLAFASYIGFIVYHVKSAFLYGTIDEEVYVSQPPGFVDPKFPKKVYVDDIIFGSTKRYWCDEIEALMKSKFQMSSMGELTFFLRLQVKQKEDGIFISQDKYVAEILKKFEFASLKTASTLIKIQKPLTKDEEAADVDVHLYRSMIGSLMCLTASRPDIMFAVCACSRFQVTQKTSHLHVVKRIFRYLKGKPKLGLWYPRVSSFDLEAYSNSDYAGLNLDRKSTIRGYQFLGRRLISWQCKKQTIVATSTTDVEYVTAANCCRQNPVFHSKTKHIEIRHHFIRDAYENKLIQVLKIHTDDNVADLLTKAFNVIRRWTLDDMMITWGSLYSFMRATYGAALVSAASLVNTARPKLSTVRLALAIPGQTETGKESSNPLMADSLPKTIQSNDPPLLRGYTLGSREDSLKLMELLEFTTATASTNVHGDVKLNPSIDGQAKTVTEASLRRHLKLEDDGGITSLPNTEIFELLALIGAPLTSPPPILKITPTVEEPAPMPHESPLQSVHSLGCDDGSVSLIELMALVIQVKKLEKQVKTGTTRRGTKIVLSEDEAVEEDSSKEGRKEEELIELVEDQGSGEKGQQEVTIADSALNTASVPFSTARATPEVSTAAKSLGIIGEEYDKVGKKEVVSEVDIAHVIDWDDPALIRYHALQNRPRSVAEVRKSMMVYLKNQGGYRMKDFKGMSYDDIRPIFEKVWDQIHSFVPMDSEEEVQRLKRADKDPKIDELSQEQLNQMVIIVPEEGINVEALQTKYLIIGWEVHSNDTMQFWKIIRVGNHTEVYKVFKDMLKNFDKDDLIKLWSLVQERYNSSGLTEDKEIELWVELKMLFEPNAANLLEL